MDFKKTLKIGFVIILITSLGFATATIDLNDLDELCDSPNNILFRNNDSWICKLYNSFDSITLNGSTITSWNVLNSTPSELWYNSSGTASYDHNVWIGEDLYLEGFIGVQGLEPVRGVQTLSFGADIDVDDCSSIVFGEDDRFSYICSCREGLGLGELPYCGTSNYGSVIVIKNVGCEAGLRVYPPEDQHIDNSESILIINENSSVILQCRYKDGWYILSEYWNKDYLDLVNAPDSLSDFDNDLVDFNDNITFFDSIIVHDDIRLNGSSISDWNDISSSSFDYNTYFDQHLNSSNDVEFSKLTLQDDLDVQDGTGTQTQGDLFVDTSAHIVYVGQLDATASNTGFIFQDRLGNQKSKWFNAAYGSYFFGNFGPDYGIKIQNAAVTSKTSSDTTNALLDVETTSNDDVAVFTGGDFGIGTTSPDYTLEVESSDLYSASFLGNDVSYSGIRVAGSDDDAKLFLEFYNSDSGEQSTIRMDEEGHIDFTLGNNLDDEELSIEGETIAFRYNLIEEAIFSTPAYGSQSSMTLLPAIGDTLFYAFDRGIDVQVNRPPSSGSLEDMFNLARGDYAYWTGVNATNPVTITINYSGEHEWQSFNNIALFFGDRNREAVNLTIKGFITASSSWYNYSSIENNTLYDLQVIDHSIYNPNHVQVLQFNITGAGSSDHPNTLAISTILATKATTKNSGTGALFNLGGGEIYGDTDILADLSAETISAGNGFTGNCVNVSFVNGIAVSCND